MAQSLHFGLEGPFTNVPFGMCALYFDPKVILSPFERLDETCKKEPTQSPDQIQVNSSATLAAPVRLAMTTKSCRVSTFHWEEQNAPSRVFPGLFWNMVNCKIYRSHI